MFIAHSLVGLVLKQAMMGMASEYATATDLKILSATYAILFFGVPNQGMDIRSLRAMMSGQPNEPFTAYFDKDASYLHQLVEQFQKTFPFQDSHIVSFFETKALPTAKLDSSGRWTMTGEPAVLVNRHSAKNDHPWEDQRSNLFPINCTHSDMVKFCEHDEVVIDYLRNFANVAPAVIRSRFTSRAGMIDSPTRDQVSSSPSLSTSAASSASHPQQTISDISAVMSDQQGMWFLQSRRTQN